MRAPEETGDNEPRIVGRYLMFEAIAAGGMASVHFGRLRGARGFGRTVAIKRLHRALANEPSLVTGLLEEARIGALIRHPNVVSILDVVEAEREIFLVMDYVAGESLAKLVRAHLGAHERPPDARIVVAIVVGALRGLHAAHEATSDSGDPLGIIHRDVSPQNVLVGTDGIPRVVDFGIAKAIGRVLETTRAGELKGKLAYMAPEQLVPGGIVTRRTDVYAAGVVLWEALTATRLFTGEFAELTDPRRRENVPPPSTVEKTTPKILDEIVLRALGLNPGTRFETAEDMARELESAVKPATPEEVGAWVAQTAQDDLARRALRVVEIGSRADAVPVDGDGGPVVRGAPKRRWRVAGALAVVATAAMSAVLLGLRAKAHSARVDAETNRTVATPASSSSLAPVHDEAPANAAADPPSLPVSSGPSNGASAAHRRGVWPKPSPAARNCEPPYYFKDGLKVFRPECLR
jgi:serine/threonine-protein kinase